MIDVSTQRLSLSFNKIRKTTGRYKDIREFLRDTYGAVMLEPFVQQGRIWGIDNQCKLKILHKAPRNDRVTIVTEGSREYEETMDEVGFYGYSQKIPH